MNSKADSALNAIPTPADRDTWYKILMAYKAAGGDQDTADQWSQRGDGYDPRSFRDTWRSIKTDGGITEASLYGAEKYQSGQRSMKQRHSPYCENEIF